MPIISLQAAATTIRKVFGDAYIIPQFQRPYVWDKENCDILWSDILEFHESPREEDEEFFLGSIVLYKEKEHDKLCVIDGQQRLTTLLLLIKALFDKSTENMSLQECLWEKDPLKGNIDQEKMRLKSDVIAKDHEHMKEILGSSGWERFDDPKKSNIHENYVHLSKAISDTNPTKLGELILTILDNVVLLPIQCDSRTDALKIFQSINNRGMQLDDSDIFKSEIYRLCKSDKERNIFIKRWTNLDDPMDLFRVYMYIHRAMTVKHQEKEKALLSYFAENRYKKLRNYNDVMSVIEKVSLAEEWLKTNKYWWHILSTLPNHYWRFPLFVFLNQHGIIDSNGVFNLGNKEDDFDCLMRETAKYFFIKGVVHNAVNLIKPATFKVCSNIAHDQDYVEAYRTSVEDDMDDFYKAIDNNLIPKKYIKGMVLVGAAIRNSGEHDADFLYVIGKKYDIEHILPRAWKSDYYGDWDKTKADSVMNMLGNLMPLEKRINIKAGNNFFGRKKEEYEKSKIQDALDLVSNPSDNWSYKDHNERHEKILKRFKEFFKYDK